MKTPEKKEFVPFHAINEFMRNDFRLSVIRDVMLSLSEIDKQTASILDRLTRKYVRVSGFRNSSKAPGMVKAVASVKPFQKQPELVAAVLHAWASLNPILKNDVYTLLVNRGWKILPMEANRMKLPGFLSHWPDGEDYETLYDALQENNPENDASMDETSLMVVYLSGRLPIEKVKLDELNEFDIPDTFQQEST